LLFGLLIKLIGGSFAVSDDTDTYVISSWGHHPFLYG
jgi:hypothetical protein